MIHAKAATSTEKRLTSVPPLMLTFSSSEMKSTRKRWVGFIVMIPVMYHQADNIYYLNHNSNGEDTACGAIYIDCSNFPDFRDTNTIIHGHHLNDGSMFGSLGRWSDQEYFDSHKVFYLNTPDSNYKVVMFAYFETPVGSSVYQIDFSGQEEISQWVKWLQNESLIKSDYEYMTGDHFIVLSTCMYSFENARGVLCGYVIPLKQ